MKSLFFLLIFLVNGCIFAQVKKVSRIEILADDKLDKDGFISKGKQILNSSVAQMIQKNYNGKLENPSINVNIIGDNHEVGAYELIIYFFVNTPKNYNDDNFCKTICNILETDFLKFNVKTGNCDCRLAIDN